MPRPFVAYLRVYEPLSAFDTELSNRLRNVVESDPLVRSAVGEREREMWFRSQLSVPPRLLPGESADGSPSPRTLKDALVLQPRDVPGAADGTGPLVCPLDVMPRSAAALVGFLATAHPALRDAAISASTDAIRARAASVLSEQPSGAVHAVSTTWTVPLPWFVMFEPAHRRLNLAPVASPDRESSWRATMADAQARVSRAYELAASTFGERGPAKVLEDTAGWLEHFDGNSAVELDYGGLVQLLDDEQLAGDSTCEDVNAIVDALESGDAEIVAERFEQLREFWGELAIRERFN
ncbi:hypothetical protein [Kibdelosporangium phytohabitans]|uniref:DUF8083 domain-containing protein n=1 Tax=Kibdelosporangium phytohabitans TaxID=860235 RepID=A0A0N9I5R7_9PSEU|nr:hypothetical protein [Kibdelosporangium phytohabitans]ALG14184.1 hypothetical protein AOZ06_51495 [Kibdelosporangium phytohabitans]